MEMSEYTHLISGSANILEGGLTKEEKRFVRSTRLRKLVSSRPHLEQTEVIKVFARLPPFTIDDASEDSNEPVLHNEFVYGNEGWSYAGQVDHNNRMHGRGLLLMDDGSIFEGQFNEGQIEGYGRLIKSKLIVYIGDWTNSKLAGAAMMIMIKEKKIYEGILENMIPARSGTLKTEQYTYEGQFKSGLKHGKGKITWVNGNSFTGTLNYNKFEGYGEYLWANGNSYKGEWQNNKMEGKGVYRWNDGTYYDGHYKDGLRDGYGIMVNPNNTQYKGYWNKGREDGIGTEVMDDGSSRRGIWKNGVFFKYLEDGARIDKASPALSPILLKAVVSNMMKNKSAEMPKADKPSASPIGMLLFKGLKSSFGAKNQLGADLKRNKLKDFSDLTLEKYKKSLPMMQSLPAFLYDSEFIAPSFLSEYLKISNNSHYKGETTSANVPDGNGIMVTEEGDIYQGRWQNGQMFGYGRHINKRGYYFEGMYHNGKRHGFGIEIKNSNKYAGDWVNDKKRGRGSLKTKDGLYNGSWKEGQQNGHGRVLYRDGTTYFGNFANGSINGRGVLTDHKGRVFNGNWRDGQFIKS